MREVVVDYVSKDRKRDVGVVSEEIRLAAGECQSRGFGESST